MLRPAVESGSEMIVVLEGADPVIVMPGMFEAMLDMAILMFLFYLIEELE
jgi:hypothetical protein